MDRYLTIKRIEFLVTYLCNSQCAHCYATKHKEGVPTHIDKSLAVDIVRKVGKKYNVESVMTFGGEPLLFPEIVCSIHKEATKTGIPVRQVISNGYWSDDIGKIRRIASNLAECGVNDMHISVDAFHQEHIPLTLVRKVVESCLEVGIEDTVLNPCWVISRDDDNMYNQKTRAILKELDDLHVRVSRGNVLEPDGLALINLREFLPQREIMPTGECGDAPYTEPLTALTSISVKPDGRIAVCNDLYIGNTHRNDILDILMDYDPFKIPEMKAIIEKGMKGLVNWVKKEGVIPNQDGYYSVCHMCIDLRKRSTSRNNNW